ncbi:MAG: DCC1-like thiol-disulfide oxidoreductase family protein [Candidatus Kapaibacterium sp.]|nr:MAG: DCC1-like thiol-disulfide oxidoreductase family protein [Candidatus Kapabacteria bacterium]
MLFDGVCTLCNGTVDFLIRNDRTETLLFAPLQSVAGTRILQSFGVNSMPESVCVVFNSTMYTQSNAVIFLLRYCRRWHLTLAGILLGCFPPLLRDPAYRYVAARRYRWFGRKESCRLPTPAERKRFLG